MSAIKSPQRQDSRQAQSPAQATPAKAPNAATVNEEELHGTVEILAYELYEKRGGADGHDLEDWYAAETAVKARLAR